MSVETIDISQIFKNSNSKFLKNLPNYAVRIIAKIIKQEEINQFIKKYPDVYGVDLLPKIVEEFNLKFTIEGEENLPDKGKCFFVANHPFGMIDGLILTSIVGKKYGDLKAIGNDAWLFVPNLRPIIASVNVFGKNSRKEIMELEKIYASDIPITHFPYGLVSRIYKFKIQDKFWTKSFIKKAILNKRDIVPIRFYGKNSNLFYAIYLFRQIFRIKANIELALLPREFFRKRGKTIKVKISKPVQHKELSNSLSHWDWAQKIRAIVYN
ncbi:MAG: 1-acyl-sn-glycerol-3-phosphate acyltransferase [Bacteroidetes bacterium]|nr:1-acyl-sn-glycerol-3-phosphate acyltransferase [Bacteroidota bacterium]